MAKVNTYLHAFSTGVHDSTALPRIDLERMRLAAEIQTNLLCRATGPGFMRPGLGYLTSTYTDAEARLKEFIFGVSDAALMEFTNQNFRVMVNDVIVTRPAVSSTVVNGDFSSATGWNTAGVGGGTSTISGGKLTMNAVNIEGIAVCLRSVTTSTPNVEHALRIVVERGPVTFRCGSTSGGDEYVSETTLPTGVHSLAFTPTGTFYVQFTSKLRYNKIVDSIQIEAAGPMILPTPWLLSDLPSLRVAQSADVCFVACEGYQQRRIERRATRSWSVALYVSDDGPLLPSPDKAVRLRPGTLEGNTSLTSSSPYFTPQHVGALFSLTHTGQVVIQSLAQDDTYTDTIRVSGIYRAGTDSDRDFAFTVAGTWSGTIVYQRSYDDPDTGFVDVGTVTVNGTTGNNDNADNTVYYYRVGFAPGGYVSGTASITIQYFGGGGTGICRVTDYVSPTQVNIEVITPFLNNHWTRDWRPSEWSDASGWPSAVALSDGRLWWSGADRIWGSVSDAFASFDDTVEGDSGPISRSIATGGVNSTQWLLSLKRLLVGTEGAIATVKSSSLDEPLTPTNFGIRDSSTTGAAGVDPIKVDMRGIFVERAGTALLELTFNGESSDYIATQISKLTTDLFGSGVKSISVQRRPDTRIWLVLNDGSCVCMVYEADQEVLAFIPIETDGDFESVAVLPSLIQDTVYFAIRRTINGSTVRYIEKMAMDTDVRPTTLCKVMDAYTAGVNPPATSVVHVGQHLTGASVVVWADGQPVESAPGVPLTFVVDVVGNITLPAPVTNWVAGLPYRARYKSARLAYGAQGGTAMLQKKTVDNLGLILTDFVRAGIRYGKAFDDPYRALDRLPMHADGKEQPAIVLSDIRDEEAFPFPGEWDTDSRVCIECSSPYTMTALGLVMGINTNER
ncbi:hypothetical protein [Rhizobium sp. BK251]|uniref:hypothetical protein n=1 Tax=Rhizobium sp. BK251 TaxID=2512125 RepID=UPI00104E246B|nr:hypothetical protein [Rhizobium sp. BK251]TCL70651.1 hypothetical protein EV286_107529 [Rhizobium sp. BK251]